MDAARAEAAAGWARYRETDPEWAAQYQLLYARALLYSGEYQEVLRVLASYPDSGPSEGAVQRLTTEAGALTTLGQPAAADERLAEADALCRRADLAACGGVMSARAPMAYEAGQAEQGHQYYLQSYEFARSHHDLWRQANVALNLGFRALQAERLDEAIDWSRISYQTASQHGYDGVTETAAGNLGYAYYQLGDGERALGRYAEAVKNAERLGDEEGEFRSLSMTSYVYRDREEWDRAEGLQRKALALARKTSNKDQEVDALGDLASLETSKGDLKEADAYLQEALKMQTAGGRKPRPVFVFMDAELAAAQHAYAQAEEKFHAVLSDAASPMAVRLNAGNDLGRIYEDQGKHAAAERMYKATIAAWGAARAQLQREESQLSFGTNVSEIYRNYVRFLVERGRTAEALALADQSRARTLAEGLGMGQIHERAGSAPEALHPEQIARKRDATLLFYWLGEEESYLWAIGPEKTVFSKLPGEKEIAARVARYNRAILDANPRVSDTAEAGNADGTALYAALVAPARKSMDARRPVIVLADGELSQLNFETLLAPDGEQQASGAKAPAYHSEALAYQRDAAEQKLHYLVEDYTLLSAPSLEMLAHGDGGVEKGARGGRNLLMIGNPSAADADFPPLPLFGVEMRRIAGHFGAGEAEVIAGERATPEAYAAANPEKYAYIHFVSHAMASRTSPLDSAIILSNPGGAAGSGVSAYKLYAREIVGHPLQARLVTISACYGSGTRAYAGEGLVGLSWAFLRAGARQVVAALWEVTDESTPRLMDGLYAGIAAGKRPAEALRDAKLEMLRAGLKDGSRFREPYYWAPFVIYSRE
jgi:CHAT domain-containing protein